AWGCPAPRGGARPAPPPGGRGTIDMGAVCLAAVYSSLPAKTLSAARGLRCAAVLFEHSGTPAGAGASGRVAGVTMVARDLAFFKVIPLLR
ncbi:MAG: hypothetical protein AB1558_10175, partial [Thermodesulfobacteriota bacterium]